MTSNRVGQVLADNHANAPRRLQPVEIEIKNKAKWLEGKKK